MCSSGKHSVLFFLLLLLIEIPALMASDNLTVLVNQPGTLVIEITIDTLTANNGAIYTTPNLSKEIRSGYPILPVIKDVLVGVPASTSMEIYTDKGMVLDDLVPVTADREQAKGIDFVFEATTWDGSKYPENIVLLSSKGEIQGHASSAISIFPAQIKGAKLTWYKSITVKLTWAVQENYTPQLFSTSDFSEIKSKITPSLKKQSNISSYQLNENLVRLAVAQDGWYKVTYSELADSGIAVKKIDPTTFQVFNQEDETLILVEGEEDKSFNNNDYIIFKGEKAPPPAGVTYQNNFYTDENVYWLTWGMERGARYISESGYPNLSEDKVLQPVSYRHREHIEEDQYFSRLSSMNTHQQWDTFDHFFMEPAINAGTSRYFTFILPYPYSTSASEFEATLEIQGITSGNHILQAYINNTKIASATWSEQAIYQITEDKNLTLTNDILEAGDNILMLTLDGSDPDNQYDQVYLNWLEIEYDRKYQAYDDEIIFSRDSELDLTTQFEINGFSNNTIFVFKENTSRIRDFLIVWDSGTNSNKIVFQDYLESNNTIYHAFTNDRLLTVKSLHQVEPLTDIISNSKNEYLVIAPDSFRVILEPLVQYHDGSFINIDDIYRSYSGGVLSPYAIKDFFTNIYDNSSTLPKIVLLGMQGGLFGWEGIFRAWDCYIPAMKIQTEKWGAASSDFWYSLVDGDDLIPEFAIGRFPAKNIQELELMVDKTMQLLENEPENWHNQLLMIAGYEETFKNQSETMLAAIINHGFFPKRLYIDKYSEGGIFFGSTDTLIKHFNDGLLYINFLGHGGGAVWGDRSLLTVDDLDYLSNSGKTPFVTSMTCFTGDVTNSSALGRQLMQHSNGGVSAWFGSSGVGWIENDFLLLQPLQDYLFNNPAASIGEAITKAKIQYYSTNYTYPDIAISQIYQFNLSGDPGLILPWATKTNIAVDKANPEPGDQIQFDFAATAIDSVRYQLFDNNNYPVSHYPKFSVGNNSIVIPDTLDSGDYKMILSWQTNNELFRATQSLAISGDLVEITQIKPLSPTSLDSIEVFTQIATNSTVQSVLLWLNGGQYSEMATTDGLNYFLPTPVPPQIAGSNLSLRCKAIDTDSTVYWSDYYSVSIPQLPAYSIDGLELNIDDGVYLSAAISNSTTGTGQVITTFQRAVSGNWITLGYDTLSFSGPEKTTTGIGCALPIGTHAYRVFTTSEYGKYDDTSTTAITTDVFWITPELGTTTDLVNAGPVGIDGFNLEILPGETTANCALRIDPKDSITYNNQGGLDYSTIDSIYSVIGIECNTRLEFSGHWQLNNTLPDSIDLYQYFPEREIWLPLETGQTTGNLLEFSATLPTELAFMTSSDQQQPVLEATINGQRILNNSYLNKSPYINLLAQDDNGIDHRESAIQIWLNNSPVINPDLIHNTGTTNTLTIQYTPSLTSGDTSLAFLIRDASNNASDTLELNFIVSEKLHLIDYGNFPNPFTDQTRFAFELTETVDQFSLDIYTVSGRRIRRLTQGSTLTDLDPRIGAYHEIIWDGRDDKGDFVANGVYFYQIKIKKDKTKIERRGKIAKAR